MSVVREEVWIEPEWAEIHHPISARSTGSGRVTELLGGVLLRFGSLLEWRVAIVLAAMPSFGRLRTQAEGIPYVGNDGRRHVHHFDLDLTERSGFRRLIAVKPSEEAKRIGFDEELKLIAHATPRSRADKVEMRTERFAPQWKVDNALLVIEAQRAAGDDPRAAARHDAILDDRLAQGTDVRSYEAWIDVGVDGAALMRAVGDGRLRILTPGRLEDVTLIGRRP